jgi:hypothetical protein
MSERAIQESRSWTSDPCGGGALFGRRGPAPALLGIHPGLKSPGTGYPLGSVADADTRVRVLIPQRKMGGGSFSGLFPRADFCRYS